MEKEISKWEKEFEEFYFETGKYTGRESGMQEYVKFIKGVRQEAIEEILKECIGNKEKEYKYDFRLNFKTYNDKRQEIINLAETKYGVKL